MSDNSSENSAVKSDGGGDVTAKYSRLAAEYSKVRAQNTVLKKAIVEEQNKSSQFNDIVREKDQSIRKSSQEIESLNFRNSQLLRRVTVLQEEIDLLNKNGKKKTKNTSDFSNGVVDNSFLEEDMKKTIIENAKLISKLNDKEEDHQREIVSMMGQISSLNDEINKKNTLVQQMRMDYELTIDQLHKEQRDFKRDYANNVNKLKETEIELSTLKSAHKQYVNEVGPKLEAVSRVLEKKIPFFDEENAELNLLNVQNFQNRDDTASTELLQKYLDELILIFYNIIHNVTFELKHLGFGELKIYLKTLLKEEDGILLNEKLNACYHLLENIELDCNIPDSIEYVVKKFVQNFLDYCSILHSSYFHRCNTILTSSNNKATSLSQALRLFRSSTKEMMDKVTNLPNSQQELIREEFVKLNAALDKVIAETENVDLKRSQSITAVNDGRNYKATASKYLRSLIKEKSEFIPYEEAIVNKSRLQELMMVNNSLTSELKNLETIIVKLEQEKVYLLNQCEVLQIKLGDGVPQHPSAGSANEVGLEVTNDLGKLIPAENMSPEILAREKQIQNHMMSKLDEMVVLKEEACSKARTYLLECQTLKRRLENNAVEKQLLENKYLESNRSSLELREELSTVSQNYEVQLSMMSDHLASVNERLAQQSEEIDNLKYQLSSKDFDSPIESFLPTAQQREDMYLVGCLGHQKSVLNGFTNSYISKKGKQK